MTIEIFLFYFFSITALISSIMVISAKNPIHSILFLILVFCNAAGLLILLETEFLAMIFLIVYVGAIAVLFLFVIMMLNIKIIELNENVLRYLPIGSIIAIIFLFEIFLIIDNDLIPIFSNVEKTYFEEWEYNINNLTNIEVIGILIYTHYFYLFLMSSIILLIAMVGAIVLTLHERTNLKKQEIYKQLLRNFNQSIRVINN